MIRLFMFIAFLLCLISLKAQKTIAFPSIDSLTITADLYEEDVTKPYIVMFHQANYSRGEFKETAPKFVRMNFNCMAVDLRSGKEVNYIKNQTAAAAREKNLPTDNMSAYKDMQAAVDYLYSKTGKPVIVLGSSFSASLSLILAKNNPKIKAVLAFSPGEYFDYNPVVREAIAGLDKPIFVATMAKESMFMLNLLIKVDPKNVTKFSPVKEQGAVGSKALWENNKCQTEYWLALMQFIDKKLK